MSKIVSCPEDCRDHKNVTYTIRNGGDRTGEVWSGKGDHAKGKYHGKQMTYCQRDMGKGLACKIFKWLKTVGLCTIFIFGLIAYNTHSEEIASVIQSLDPTPTATVPLE